MRCLTEPWYSLAIETVSAPLTCGGDQHGFGRHVGWVQTSPPCWENPSEPSASWTLCPRLGSGPSLPCAVVYGSEKTSCQVHTQSVASHIWGWLGSQPCWKSAMLEVMISDSSQVQGQKLPGAVCVPRGSGSVCRVGGHRVCRGTKVLLIESPPRFANLLCDLGPAPQPL